MSIAEKYFKEQMNSDEFKRAYLEEKTRLDIEYRLEELKRDIRTRKSRDELIEKVENLEKFVMGA
jgi:polyhydroxyalkanoate synthesis regulator phasin